MKVVKKARVPLHGDLETTTAKEVWLGVALEPEPFNGTPRRIWGVVDDSGEKLVGQTYDAEYYSPAHMANEMEAAGGDRFDIAGKGHITLSALQYVTKLLGLNTPARYMGVPVPSELWTNWDQPEAYWWQNGVRAALDHVSDHLRPLVQEVKAEGPRT